MRRRAAFILFGASAIAVVAFLMFPDFDLVVARRMLRPDGHFLLFWVGPFVVIHQWIWVPMALCVGFFALAAIAYWRGRPIWGIAPWHALYVFAVFAVGPGLLANTLIKDHSGRPRPGETQEFGGAFVYAPPFDFSGACERNCSFVSGDPTAGFFFLAPALLLPSRWRRAGIAGALLLGGSIGLMRMLQGSHFLSDVIFSGLLVAATALALHWAMFRADGRARSRLGERLSA